jgi:phosphonate transport system substrate-binding protein
MYQLYQPFVDYLSESTSYLFEIKLFRSYEETIDRLGRGDIAIASCGPVPFIKAQERYRVKPIVRALSKDGKASYQGVIIVRQNSPIQTLADLRGKSFAFGQQWSTAGHILPEYYLLKANIRLKDLKHYSFLAHHDSVVKAVLKGEVDAGAVKDIIAYEYEKYGLRFLLKSDPIPTVLIVARADAPVKLVEDVKRALLKLDPQSPEDRKRMSAWDDEFKYGFTEAADADYDPVRRILRAIEIGTTTKGAILK